jgi:hypothetical protein
MRSFFTKKKFNGCANVIFPQRKSFYQKTKGYFHTRKKFPTFSFTFHVLKNAQKFIQYQTFQQLLILIINVKFQKTFNA